MTPLHNLGWPSLRRPVHFLRCSSDWCAAERKQLLEGMPPVGSSLTLCHAVCCRVANMYFLFIAALQLIPGLSPTSWVTTVAPLCFVLFINGVKVGPLGLLSVMRQASKLQPAWTPCSRHLLVATVHSAMLSSACCLANSLASW